MDNKEIQTALDITNKLVEIQGSTPQKFIINIGCHDGKSMNDPCFDYFNEYSFPGLCIDAGSHDSIYENLPSNDVIKKMDTVITPSNAQYLLKSHNCPLKVHFLKIDIDSYDGLILKSILEAGYEADIIQVEINPDIPPPIKFSLHWHRMLDPKTAISGFYGASVSYITSITDRYNYVPFILDNNTPSHDLILVSKEVCHKLKIRVQSIEDIYKDSKPGFSHFYSYLGVDTSQWRNRKDYDRLICEIWQVIVHASMIKHGVVMPFLLDIE